MNIVIRDREAGNVIDKFRTIEEARMKLEEYEKEDKEAGVYVKDFYEIYDFDAEEVVE